MPSQLRTFLFKTPVKLALGLISSWLLFGWLALGPLLKWGAEKYVAEKTGDHLVMDTPRFDPLGLELTLKNVRLTDPDGRLLAGFKALFVDFEVSSLFHRTWTFDTIRLLQPTGNLALLPGGRLNWSPFLDAFKGKSATDNKDNGMPRLLVRHFDLQDGRSTFSDHTVQPAFETTLTSLDLSLDDLATLPDDMGDYQIAAHTSSGAVLRWKGSVELQPVVMTGALSLDGVQLAQLKPYLEGHAGIAAPEGRLAVTTQYRLTYTDRRFGLTLDPLGLTLDGLRLRDAKAAEPALALKHFAVKGARFDLASHKIDVGKVSLDGGQVNLTRLADGSFDVEHWLPASKPVPAKPSKPAAKAQPVTPWHIGIAELGLDRIGLRLQGQGVASPVEMGLDGLHVEGTSIDLAAREAKVKRVTLDKPQVTLERTADGSVPLLAAFAAKPSATRPAGAKSGASSASGPGWTWRLARAELNDGSVLVRDEAVKPAAALNLENIDASIAGLSQDLDAKSPVKLALKVKEGGSLSAKGTLVPGKAALDAGLDLKGLNLTPVQPYLGSFAKLRLTAGALDSSGRVTLGDGIDYRGRFRVTGLTIDETDTGRRFLAWRDLTGAGLRAGSQGVGIDDLSLDGLSAKLFIHKDKSTNLADILRKPLAPAPKQTQPAAAGVTGSKLVPAMLKQAAFPVSIAKVTLKNGEMDYADESLVLPFAAHIHGLTSHIDGISNQEGKAARLELDGLVDKSGSARASGRINLFDPTAYTDIKVVFRHIEMTRLTPYSATFAGREIKSGKLALDLDYKVKDQQMVGNNRIVMEQLTLGKRVKSPTAEDLPLDLAIAILQNADGVIDLGLPVSGNLKNPQFSYGSILWKAFAGLIGKTVLAPFKALGSLFGGSGEKASVIAFDAGRVGLLPSDTEKLKQAVRILTERPQLALTVTGGWNAEADAAAIRKQRVRRALAEAMGQTLQADAQPGPIDLHQDKAVAGLETLYARRFGPAALAAFKSRFVQANPAAPPTSEVGRLWDRLDGAFKAKPAPITPAELARMKGANEGDLLFQSLVDKEVVTDAQLATLGKARGAAMMSALKALDAPAGRVIEKPAQAVTGASATEVDLELGLEVAPDSAPDAA